MLLDARHATRATRSMRQPGAGGKRGDSCEHRTSQSSEPLPRGENGVESLQVRILYAGRLHVHNGITTTSARLEAGVFSQHGRS